MSHLNSLRKQAFWLLDRLKGSPIKAHLKDIDQILKDPFSQNSMLKRDENLQKLLVHACKTVPFYRKFQGKALKEFPVIKKNMVQDNFDQFKSTPYLEKKLYKVATSGSTGMPFVLYQNKNKKLRNTADVLHFFDKTNHTLGNRLYEFEVWRGHNKKGKLKSKIQNLVQYDISVLPNNRIEELLRILDKDKQPKTFLGFASAYESICKYLDKNNPSFELNSVNAIIANSEYLNAYTKKSMNSYFKAPVFSRYSNEELGILAHQINGSDHNFAINHASYKIELLDMEEDRPAKIGKFGRIVVTDLFNYAMPLIRFDTGDIAKFNEDSQEFTHFEAIEGRKMDLIQDTSGNIISSFLIYTKFYPYYDQIKQYQFVQEDEKSYTVILNANPAVPFENELIKDIKKDFGQDAEIKITYVNEIPPLASGKRKKVVNKYLKQ